MSFHSLGKSSTLIHGILSDSIKLHGYTISGRVEGLKYAAEKVFPGNNGTIRRENWHPPQGHPGNLGPGCRKKKSCRMGLKVGYDFEEVAVVLSGMST